jgi:hypothetical protein
MNGHPIAGELRLSGVGLLLCALAVAPLSSAGPHVAPLVAKFKSVGREAAGNRAAARAWRQLVQSGPDVVPALLAALDGADPVAANWLQTAIDAVCEQARAAKRPLPKAELEAFVRDGRHTGHGRRLAYEWLTRIDPAAPDRLLPGMLRDPSADLRRDAVARVVADAERQLQREDKPAAAAALRKAFAAACDRDQVERIAKQLQALGVAVNLTEHFGFIRDWLLVGPFDNSDGVGYHTAFPPEKAVDPAATYRGKNGAELRWAPFRTADPYGVVDLNRGLGADKSATAYAFAVVTSPREQPVQVRVGSDNAIKIFLNGKEIFAHEDYHVGTRMDQYVGRGALRAGRNEILLKVCQNENAPGWTPTWNYQLRVCDALGGPVPFRVAAGKKEQP